MEPEAKVTKWFQDPGLKKIIFLTVAFKLSTFIVIAVGGFFLPFRNDNYLANFHYPHDQIPNFFTRFATWDAQHYLYLADHGYESRLMSNSFYPLFPFLIHCLSFLFLGNTLTAGLLLSTLFTIISMSYLYLLVREKYEVETARQTCLLLLAFPMSFFLGLVYSDSIFLMLSTAFFYYLNDRKLWPAFVCACLLPLSRPAGFLIAIPTLVFMFKESRNTRIQKYCILLFGFLFGFTVYLFIFKIFTGNPWAGFNAQGYYTAGNSLQNLLHPLDWVSHNFLTTNFSLNNPANGLLSRFCFVGFLVVFLQAWKNLDEPLLIYSLVIGLVTALSGTLTSYPRYMVMIFPFFILMGFKIKDKIPCYLAFCIPLQILFTLLYSMNEWVA